MERERLYKYLTFFNWWTDDVWYIGGRMSPQSAIHGQENTNSYKLLHPTYKYWYADPIPYILDGKYYIFMEVYDRFLDKGFIGVSSVNDNEIIINRPIKIIEEPFHMSFPYIFQYKGSVYMIPETHQAKQIRIYKMNKSVYDWELYHVYDTEEELSDTIVLVKNEIVWLLSTDKDKRNPYRTRMHLFKINNLLDRSELIEIPLVRDKGIYQNYFYNNRNGGGILKDKNKIYRVIQEAEDMWYGKDIVIREILECGDDGYIESPDIVKLEVNELPINIKRRHMALGMHTYGFLDGFEVIDINVRQLSYIVFQRFIQRNINKFRRKN